MTTIPVRDATTGAGPGALEPPAGSYEAIDAYVERERRRLRMPGVALAIVEGDQIVHQRGFGRVRSDGETPGPQTPFPIASLTKSITALAVMQLVEDGKIELDAPVQRYLPWFRVADPGLSARITVRHLLNQTSGLPTSAGEIPLADFDARPGAAERHARALSTLALDRPAGSAYEYSNANYILLGLIVEAASGEAYADYIRRTILTPLGMSQTTTLQATARQNGLAVGHRYWFGVPVAAPDLPLPAGALAGGGLISSAAEMARYLSAHLNGGRYGDERLLSSAGMEELHRGVADIKAYGLSLGQYAMGWVVDQIGQTKLLWHGGTLPDFGAYMALLPEQKKGVVLLFNGCHHWMNPVLADVGLGVTSFLAGERPTSLRSIRLIPWLLRAQLLLPLLQIAGVVATLLRLRRWRLRPESRPGGGGVWRRHLVLPLVLNLQLGLALLQPRLGKRRGYLRLYMPDFSLIAAVSGSFALLWGLLRSGLVGRALRKP